MNDEELLRYSRHILLDGMDLDGQQSLKEARVLIVGLGGLGCPVALYLAASGVGHIELIDPDVVELSNLQRQIAHGMDDLGKTKVASVAESIRQLNPLVSVVTHEQAMDADALTVIASNMDLLLDCTDNARVRYEMNQSCIRTGTPWLSAAAVGMSGQLVFFDPRCAESPCYRCLYPDLDADASSGVADGCAENGVLAPIVGVVGCLQATEALKYLSGMGTPDVGLLQLMDFGHSQWRRLSLKRRVQCPDCQS